MQVFEGENIWSEEHYLARLVRFYHRKWEPSTKNRKPNNGNEKRETLLSMARFYYRKWEPSTRK